MINACCNLYFCFIITVHGDIRHLEMTMRCQLQPNYVHGDIRHLEMKIPPVLYRVRVHGDIRHLENKG